MPPNFVSSINHIWYIQRATTGKGKIHPKSYPLHRRTRGQLRPSKFEWKKLQKKRGGQRIETNLKGWSVRRAARKLKARSLLLRREDKRRRSARRRTADRVRGGPSPRAKYSNAPETESQISLSFRRSLSKGGGHQIRKFGFRRPKRANVLPILCPKKRPPPTEFEKLILFFAHTLNLANGISLTKYWG